MKKVNINEADHQYLLLVKGIGQSLTRRILGERDRGPFQDAEDLAHRVKGIGLKTASEKFTFEQPSNEEASSSVEDLF